MWGEWTYELLVDGNYWTPCRVFAMNEARVKAVVRRKIHRYSADGARIWRATPAAMQQSSLLGSAEWQKFGVSH